MKASKFTDARKVQRDKQGENPASIRMRILGRDICNGGEICRKSGISSATYFNWKKGTRG